MYNEKNDSQAINLSFCLEQKVYDCDNNRHASLSIIYYDNNNEPMNHYKTDENHAEWMEATPNTINSELMNMICTRHPFSSGGEIHRLFIEEWKNFFFTNPDAEPIEE